MGNALSFLSRQRSIKNSFNNIQVQLDTKIGNKGINDEDLKLIEDSQTHKVEVLSLRVNLIGLHGLTTIMMHKWPNLTTLRLQSNNIGAKGCKYFSQSSQSMPKLTWLSFCNNKINDEGILHLSKSQLPNLYHLNIGYNHLTQAAIPHFSRSNFKKLQYIFLLHNDLTYEGAIYLVCSSFIEPQQFGVEKNKMSKKQDLKLRNAIRAKYPKYWTSC